MSMWEENKMLALDPNQLLIIPTSNDDRPLKFCIEDSSSQNVKSEIRNVSESERLINTLQVMKTYNLLTTQQLRSLRGQIKKGYYTIVHQFLMKRGDWYGYFLNLPLTEEVFVITRTFGANIIGNKYFGVYTYE